MGVKCESLPAQEMELKARPPAAGLGKQLAEGWGGAGGTGGQGCGAVGSRPQERVPCEHLARQLTVDFHDFLHGADSVCIGSLL